MCGVAGIVRPEAAAAVDEQALLRMAGGHPPPRPGRLRARPRRRGRPGLDPAGHLRHPPRLAAVRVRSRRKPAGLQRRGLQPPGAAGRAERARGELHDHLRHRGRAADAGARGRRVARPVQRAVRVRLVAAAAAPLTLVRDRFGVRPLFYALLDDGTLVFGSEAKALFASGRGDRRAPDLAGIDEVFTLWGPRPPRTVFRGVSQVLPGGLVVWERGRIVEERRWWTPEYGQDGSRRRRPRRALARQRPAAPASRRSGGHLSLRRPRLEPDHRPGPGGDRSRAAHVLDRVLPTRATTSAPIRRRWRAQSARATTWSTRGRPRSPPRSRMWSGTPRCRWCARRRCRCSCWPGRCASTAITVVATGEGADELFWGYELFKEVALREIHEHRPGAGSRAAGAALLLSRARRSPAAGRPGAASCWRPEPTTRSWARISPARRRPPR